MKSSEYWQRRFDELEAAQLRKAERYNAREVDRQFQMALAKIEKELSYWYQRLGENNSISANEARKLLAADELREFHWNVEEYIQRGKESNYSDKWKKMLENASAKMHISRLDAMKLQIQQQIEVLYGNQVDGLDGLMHEMYTEGFNRSAYTLDTGVGVHYNLATTDPRRIDAIINRPWADDGKTFSERLWRDKDKLVNALQQEMTQAVTRGDKLGDAVKNISKRMGAAKSSAARLVMTESAFISGRAQRDCFKDLGVDKYEYVATLDRKTSETCRDLDGKVFEIDDYKPGTNAPPMHCWCRSCIVPYFDDMEMLGKRAARDPETGKTVRVPADMKYKDWEAVYIDGKLTIAEYEKSLENGIIKTTTDDKFGFKSIIGAHSRQDDLKAVNPNYNTGKREWTHNCQRCVSAYEARIRGYDVEALPRILDASDRLPYMLDKEEGWTSVYDNPKLIQCASSSGEKTGIKVKKQMSIFGDGARAIVRVQWQSRYGQGGHVFVAEQKDGKTLFVDPQSGREDVERYFKLAKKNATYLLRIDNLEFTDNIKKCCKNREVD